MGKSVQRVNSDLIAQLTAYFTRSNDTRLTSGILTQGAAVPGSRFLFSMGPSDASGLLYPSVGKESMALTPGGTPVQSSDNRMAYVTLNGSTDYYENASPATDYDLTGTETFIDSSIRGLIGFAWVRVPTSFPAAFMQVFGKWDQAGGATAYALRCSSANVWQFSINSGSGGNLTVDSSITPRVDTWTFLGFEFIPSTSISILVYDGTEYTFDTNITSIPANIASIARNFRVGAVHGGGSYFKGDISYIGASACLLQTRLHALYQDSRSVFAHK